MDKENLKDWSSCLLWFICALLLYKSCDWYSSYQKDKENKAYIEKKRNDSIRKAFINDSLAHDHHYQDSLRIVEAKYKKWKEEQDAINTAELAGFVKVGDSVYHTSFHTIGFTQEHPYGFMIFDRPKLKFVTAGEVEKNKLTLCNECEETEYVRIRYDDGELFDEESARDHDYIPIEDAGEYCDRHHDDY